MNNIVEEIITYDDLAKALLHKERYAKESNDEERIKGDL